MKYKTITEEEYNILLRIQKENPILTFQNNGYEYIDKSKFTEEDKKAFDEVSIILKNSIEDFSVFNNFKICGDKIMLRFQYNYDRNVNFIGVGYLELNELKTQ